LEVDDDRRLVADHPGIVARGQQRDVARLAIELGAIVHANAQHARDVILEVRRLAAARPGERLHRGRPAPARLEDGAPDRRAAGVRAVAVAVRLAGAGMEAAVAESDGLGVARALAALEHHAFEGPAVELHTVLLVVRKHDHAAPRPRGSVWAGLRTC